jgi:hypothetical protein
MEVTQHDFSRLALISRPTDPNRANRNENHNCARGVRGAAYVETFWRDVRWWLHARENHEAVTVAGSAGQGFMRIPETEGIE